jgi:hypothetical protein
MVLCFQFRHLQIYTGNAECNCITSTAKCQNLSPLVDRDRLVEVVNVLLIVFRPMRPPRPVTTCFCNILINSQSHFLNAIFCHHLEDT